MLGVVDATQAIADLTEISPQVQRVVVIAADGSLVGSNADSSAAQRLIDGARELIAATTSPEPTVGLVFYDLKTCLRATGETKKVDDAAA